ncbi:MAG: NAD(P)/FAD-dependent oxidoreductase [Endomicrobium sp.]|jgi:dihydrolipoamide dehydrogenase|nr:NAD(P)/FAD-dependent oxidoreductase [Endomicrobium sp.]
MNLNKNKYDVVAIGSGPGGFTAAVRAVQLGAKKVAIVEKSLIGGTCLNCGCLPTKFLWQALKLRQKIQKSYKYGFKVDFKPVVFSDIFLKKDKNIANLRKGMKMILSSYNVDVIEGVASFKDKNNLMVSDDKGDNVLEIFANSIIVATGTSSSVVKGFAFDGNKIINSTDILNLKKIPKNMLVIGGGAIGIEMATIFSGFGCRITLVENKGCLLPNEDREISEEIKKNLIKQGVNVLVSCSDMLNNIDEYEKILIVTGRMPNNDLNFRKIGIKTNTKGFVKTNEFCQTSVSNIYAVGDIAGKSLLAYTAQSEGAIAAENTVKMNSASINDFVIPQVVFSMPQSSSVKVSNFLEYRDVIYGKFPFTASGRAFIENEREGFVKCAVDRSNKKPLAFWIVGAHSDELINTASQIIKSDIYHMSRESVFHPSFSESLFNAYEDAFDKCVELAKKKKNSIRTRF